MTGVDRGDLRAGVRRHRLLLRRRDDMVGGADQRPRGDRLPRRGSGWLDVLVERCRPLDGGEYVRLLPVDAVGEAFREPLVGQVGLAAEIDVEHPAGPGYDVEGVARGI